MTGQCFYKRRVRTLTFSKRPKVRNLVLFGDDLKQLLWDMNIKMLGKSRSGSRASFNQVDLICFRAQAEMEVNEKSNELSIN